MSDLTNRMVTAQLNAMAANAEKYETTPAEVDARDGTAAVLDVLAKEAEAAEGNDVAWPDAGDLAILAQEIRNGTPATAQAATPFDLLAVRMDPATNGAGARTVGEYLRKLLAMLWERGEDAIKRPFGSSGWQFEVYRDLIEAEAINGELDRDGYVEDVDTRAADRLIIDAIKKIKF